MSKHMLNDEDAINDVNPFVTHDFSLPGGVRQTGNFSDFVEVATTGGLPPATKSVFCSTGLCANESEPCLINKKVHPRRTIDYGFTPFWRSGPTRTVGVSNKPVSYIWPAIILLIIVLTLLYVRR
jgi:hypothetical protein